MTKKQILIILVSLLCLISIGLCVYWLYQKFSCKNSIEVSVECSKNCDCKNGACGRASAADGILTKCCKTGKVISYAGYDYCSDMEDNSVCWSNAMCATGFCRDNGGGTRKGRCGKGNMGDSCGINNDCVNGACGRESAADSTSLTCCKSGAVTLFDGFDYCKGMPDETVCWSNDMCASGFCRDNGGGTRKGKCGKGPVGADCGVNSDCVNGTCGRESADDGAKLTCCKAGGLVTHSGFDYCKNMPDNSVCWSDSMCASGWCKDNASGTIKGKCTANKNINDPCTVKSDCKNSACGRETAADSAPLKCCPSNKTTGYGGFEYCTNMPDNSVCWSNAMCDSNYCRDNGNGTRKGKCGKGNIGEPCGVNNDCKNSACGRESAAEHAPLTCCKSGGTKTYAGFDYCSDMPENSDCWSDEMCASRFCKDNAGGIKRGKCFLKKDVGANCSVNAECKNSACGRETAAEGAPLKCCLSNQRTNYAGFDYCTNMPDNSVCWSNSMCGSGYCRDNGGGTRKGKCGKGDIGDSCGVNGDCKNSTCGRETAADGAPLTCCKSGGTKTYAGFDYCSNMPDNSVCWSDAMCASGLCKGNAGGFQKGSCAVKKDIGQSCGSNSDCKNNACGRRNAGGDDLICCPSNGITTYAFNDYCTGMPRGSVCWSDAMCGSDNCRGNLYGVQKGICD